MCPPGTHLKSSGRNVTSNVTPRVTLEFVLEFKSYSSFKLISAPWKRTARIGQARERPRSRSSAPRTPVPRLFLPRLRWQKHCAIHSPGSRNPFPRLLFLPRLRLQGTSSHSVFHLNAMRECGWSDFPRLKNESLRRVPATAAASNSAEAASNLAEAGGFPFLLSTCEEFPRLRLPPR